MEAGKPAREGIAVPKLVSNSLTTLLKDSCYAFSSVSNLSRLKSWSFQAGLGKREHSVYLVQHGGLGR